MAKIHTDDLRFLDSDSNSGGTAVSAVSADGPAVTVYHYPDGTVQLFVRETEDKACTVVAFTPELAQILGAFISEGMTKRS